MIDTDVLVCDNCGSENCPSLIGKDCDYDPADDYEDNLDDNF